MKKAGIAAVQALRKYFSSFGEDWPSDEATDLMKRVTVDGQTHSWRTRSHASYADGILHRSHFNVDDFAENFLGITLWVDQLERFDEQCNAPVFGYAKPNARVIVICERALKYEPLRRATVLHEVGHILLHEDSAARVLSYAPHRTRRPRHERQADAFMVSAILPVPIVELAITRTAEANQINLQDAFVAANSRRGRWQWRRVFFPALVNTLCVSRHLIALLLLRRRIITRDTLQYHLSYKLPNRWRAPGNCGNLGPACKRLLHDCQIQLTLPTS